MGFILSASIGGIVFQTRGDFRDKTATIWIAVAERSGDTAFRPTGLNPKAAWRSASRRSPKLVVVVQAAPGSSMSIRGFK